LKTEKGLLLRKLKSKDEVLQNMRNAQLAIGGLRNVLPARAEEFKGMKGADAFAVYVRARLGTKIPLPVLIETLLAGQS